MSKIHKFLAKFKISKQEIINGPLLGKLFLYTLPIILTSILQLLFNTADLVVIGHYRGDDALGAVSSTGALTNMLVSMFMGFSVGASVFVAQYHGAKDDKNVHETVHTAMPCSVILGGIISIIGFVLSRPLLQLLDTKPELIDMATTYVKIILLGMIPNLVYNFGAAIIRTNGDTTNPLIYLAIAGVTNVGLNYMFVAGFGMGIEGVAIATIISQTISAILIVLHLIYRSKGSERLYLKKLHIYGDKLKKITLVGLPAGIQGSIFSLSNVLIQKAVNTLETPVVNGNGASANLEGYIYVSMNAYYQTAVTFVGQNVGAKKFYRIKKIVLYTLMLVIITGFSMGMIELIFGKWLLSQFLTEEESIAAITWGYSRLKVIASIYFLCGVMDVFTGTLRGMGASIVPMGITLIGVCGTRILWIYAIWNADKAVKMVEFFGSSLAWLYVSYPVSWIIAIIAQSIYAFIVYRFIKGKYIKEHWRQGKEKLSYA